jgi:hypothetical protein
MKHRGRDPIYFLFDGPGSPGIEEITTSPNTCVSAVSSTSADANPGLRQSPPGRPQRARLIFRICGNDGNNPLSPQPIQSVGFPNGNRRRLTYLGSALVGYSFRFRILHHAVHPGFKAWFAFPLRRSTWFLLPCAAAYGDRTHFHKPIGTT